jgi:hypothetical protein
MKDAVSRNQSKSKTEWDLTIRRRGTEQLDITREQDE